MNVVLSDHFKNTDPSNGSMGVFGQYTKRIWWLCHGATLIPSELFKLLLSCWPRAPWAALEFPQVCGMLGTISSSAASMVDKQWQNESTLFTSTGVWGLHASTQLTLPGKS